MKVELEDVMFWMDAIRDSSNRYRTLESFWKGQLRSKVWLIENLEQVLSAHYNKKTVSIYGGWNGVLASLIFNSNINIARITSIDIDPACEDTAITINRRYNLEGKFTAITADMVTITNESADIVINTSCEHITQEQYNIWLNNQPEDALFVLQSNNYYDLEEHINCSKDIDDFLSKSNLKPLYCGSLELPLYNRFMLIGRKG